MRQKMKRIQSKMNKIGTYNFAKFICLVSIIKHRYYMMVLMVWLIFKKIHVNKSTFVSQTIFNKNVVASHEIKPVLTLDKRTYLCGI